MFVILD
jgi:hypothetical protein